MLSADLQYSYLVWPSWANAFSVTWAELPKRFDDPEGIGWIHANTRLAIERGYVTPTCEGYDLIDGPCGNGIIRILKPVKHWLGYDAFNAEDEISSLGGWIRSIPHPVIVSHVAYLHLRGDMGLRLWGEGKVKPREYECSVTIEHATAAGDECFWVLNYKKSRTRIPGIEEIPVWGAGFGLNVEPLASAPQPLLDETADWFLSPDFACQWYRVSGQEPLAGLQQSFLGYIALHLKKVGGSRIKAMHLVANIENKPNMRMYWSRQQR